MPLDRRATRSFLQSARGFQRFSHLRLRRCGAPAPSCCDDKQRASVQVLWLSGEEVVTLRAKPSDTVRELKRKALAAAGSEAQWFRCSLVASPPLGVLADSATVSCLDLAGDEAGDDWQVQLLLLVSSAPVWHPTLKGQNALVLPGGRHARRAHGFDRAIVFCGSSARCCRVRIMETDSAWAGSLEVGFTLQPPELTGFKSSINNAMDVQNAVACSCGEEWHEELSEGSVVEWELIGQCELAIRVGGRMWTKRRYQPWAKPGKRGRAARPTAEELSPHPFVGIYGETVAVELL